jgi:type IV pilus assembly protein PilN
LIRINLLPHREAARKRRRDVFNLSLGLSALLGVAVSAAVYLGFQHAESTQLTTNQTLQSEIRKLETQIKDIEGLEAEIAALRARQQAVEDLQSDRNLPVHLLTELVNQLPDGVFISKMLQAGQSVTINGTAQSNERVSELLRNLANNTPWFAKPELVEIVAGSVNVTSREQKRVSNFVIRVGLVRANDVEKTSSATAQVVAASPLPTSPAKK